MPAREVAVGVDHLGLDPESELHAERADVIDERVQPVRPDLPVHGPVAEARGVVAATLEPAVVEHEPLDADGCRGIGEGRQPGERVIEVDGLPRVQRHRARAPRVLGTRAPLVVEAPGEVGQTVAPRPDDPGGAVRGPALQDDLTRQEKLATGEERVAAHRAFREDAVVSAPRHVDAVHAPSLEAEAGSACGEEDRGVRAGAATAALPDVGAEGESSPLGRALAQVVPGRVEDLRRVPGQGEGRLHRLQDVGGGAGVAHRDALVEEAARPDAQFGPHRESGLGIGEGDARPVLARLHVDDREEDADTGAVAVSLESGCAEPPLGARRQEGQSRRRVEATRDALAARRDRQPRERVRCGIHERSAPVDDRRCRRRIEVDDDARAAAREVEHPRIRYGIGVLGVEQLIGPVHGLVLAWK